MTRESSPVVNVHSGCSLLSFQEVLSLLNCDKALVAFALCIICRTIAAFGETNMESSTEEAVRDASIFKDGRSSLIWSLVNPTAKEDASDCSLAITGASIHVKMSCNVNFSCAQGLEDDMPSKEIPKAGHLK